MLEQRLIGEHPHLHNVRDASLSNENSNKVNERWICKIENRMGKSCEETIQSFEKIVKEFPMQVKQQALYQERTEKFDVIVR